MEQNHNGASDSLFAAEANSSSTSTSTTTSTSTIRLTRHDVVTDRQIRLFRDLNVVEPGELFFRSGSMVAAADPSKKVVRIPAGANVVKAEALHLADRTSEALEAINEAENVVERSEEREWCAELHRIRGVLLAAMGGDGAQIEASFCATIRIAREQKSVSLEKRAEGTYAEYRRQKASGPVGHGFRLPL